MSAQDRTCDTCEESGPLYLHGRCHMSAPSWAILDGDVLTIICSVCKKQIASFKVET